MNIQRKPKHHFIRLWLNDVLIYCRSERGFLQHLRFKGHLNERYTSLNGDIMPDLETFLRIWVNLGMVVDEEDFDKEWTDLGTKIRKFARKHGVEFNKAYESKKTKH